MKKYPVGLDYKYAAQAKMHRACGGNLKEFSRQCAETVAQIERKYGIKFKHAVPADWTAPKINWPTS